MIAESKELLEHIGNEIDTLCNFDAICRKVIPHLYRAARERAGGSMTLASARLFKEALKEGGDVALIATGFPILAWLLGAESIVETDGPPGAAVLAKALERGFDAIPIVVCPTRLTEYIKGSCQGVGFLVTDTQRALKSKPSPKAFATSIVDFPSETEAARKAAASLLDTLKPRVLIAIEQPGQNDKGIYHYGSGRQIPTEIVANADILFKEARSRGIPTMGIGDGGNELGMGNIKQTVRELVPFGSRCNCPCGGGLSASTEVDLLTTAVISNWGAYGIAAMISALTQKPEAFPTWAAVKGALDGCVKFGSAEGPTGVVEAIEDGVSMEASRGFLALLKSVVDWAEKRAREKN